MIVFNIQARKIDTDTTSAALNYIVPDFDAPAPFNIKPPSTGRDNIVRDYDVNDISVDRSASLIALGARRGIFLLSCDKPQEPAKKIPVTMYLTQY